MNTPLDCTLILELVLPVDQRYVTLPGVLTRPVRLKIVPSHKVVSPPNSKRGKAWITRLMLSRSVQPLAVASSQYTPAVVARKMALLLPSCQRYTTLLRLERKSKLVASQKLVSLPRLKPRLGSTLITMESRAVHCPSLTSTQTRPATRTCSVSAVLPSLHK